VVCVFIYLAVALTTLGTLQARGLALANAVMNSSHAVILLILLRRSLPGLRLGAALVPFLARVVPATALAGAVLAVAWRTLSRAGGLLGLLAAGALVAAIYAAALLAFGVSEARAVVNIIRARLA